MAFKFTREASKFRVGFHFHGMSVLFGYAVGAWWFGAAPWFLPVAGFAICCVSGGPSIGIEYRGDEEGR